MSVRGTPKGSDENLTASSDSFWDVGNYRRTVKRIDDGAKLCDELMKLVAERAEIEAKYANKLKNWAKKWEEAIKLSSEYNTMEEAMKGTVNEANSRSNVHVKCKEDLMSNVYELVKKWKIDNYHKSLFQWKESKDAEDGFAKAQKPWAKYLMKVMRAKKAYHAATKAKEQAEKQVNDAQHDVSFPQDKLKKLEDSVEKKKDEMEKTKIKYERRLEEITNEYNDTYAEGMARQFQKCQEFEEKRLDFFKEVLMKYHRCLNISDIPEFSGIFVQMSTTFQMASSQQDLDWWSRNHGTAMPPNWPVFEDYISHKLSPTNCGNKTMTLILNMLTPQSCDSPVIGRLFYNNLSPRDSKDSVTDESRPIGRQYEQIISKVDGSDAPLLEKFEHYRNSVKELVLPDSVSLDPTKLRQTASHLEHIRMEYDENQVGPKSNQTSNAYISNEPQATPYNTYDSTPPSPPPSYDTPSYNHVNEQNPSAPQFEPEPQNPFGHQESEEYTPEPDDWGNEPPPVHTDIGVPVRALYDYDGVEDDELSFKAGDILTKLSEMDDQGWCEGRFQGVLGLFPADYVEPV